MTQEGATTKKQTPAISNGSFQHIFDHTMHAKLCKDIFVASNSPDNHRSPSLSQQFECDIHLSYYLSASFLIKPKNLGPPSLQLLKTLLHRNFLSKNRPT